MAYSKLSREEKNIEPRAWKGNYPAQLNVGWYARRGPVDARTLGIKNFIGKIILSDKEFNGIYSKFQSFRERLPPSFRADDGHYVRSENEVMIDN